MSVPPDISVTVYSSQIKHSGAPEGAPHILCNKLPLDMLFGTSSGFSFNISRCSDTLPFDWSNHSSSGFDFKIPGCSDTLPI